MVYQDQVDPLIREDIGMCFFTTLNRLAFNAVAGLCMLSTASYACTGITLKGADGTTVFARTLEWGTFDLTPDLVVIPRGTELNAEEMPDGADGHRWKTTYGVAGITALGKTLFGDVMNEQGLVVGAFYLPGFTEYQPYDPSKADISMSSSDVSGYLASQFATVAEVRDGLDKIRVVPVIEEAIGIPPPLHYMVADPTGDAIVIQYIDGAPKIFEAPLGVITNAPNYDWHVTNLNNYLNLSAIALPPVEAAGQKFAPLGAGSGMLGLPGDFTPPSRFVRAVAFSQTARDTTGGYDTVREAFRILDNFNVPITAAEGSAATDGSEDLIYSATQWTAASDLNTKRIYYHTQWNRNVRMVDINSIDFSNTDAGIIRVPLDASREPDIETILLGGK